MNESLDKKMNLWTSIYLHYRKQKIVVNWTIKCWRASVLCTNGIIIVFLKNIVTWWSLSSKKIVLLCVTFTCVLEFLFLEASRKVDGPANNLCIIYIHISLGHILNKECYYLSWQLRHLNIFFLFVLFIEIFSPSSVHCRNSFKYFTLVSSLALVCWFIRSNNEAWIMSLANGI